MLSFAQELEIRTYVWFSSTTNKQTNIPTRVKNQEWMVMCKGRGAGGKRGNRGSDPSLGITFCTNLTFGTILMFYIVQKTKRKSIFSGYNFLYNFDFGNHFHLLYSKKKKPIKMGEPYNDMPTETNEPTFKINNIITLTGRIKGQTQPASDHVPCILTPRIKTERA